MTLNDTIRANLITERELAIIHIGNLKERLSSAQDRLEYLTDEIMAVGERIAAESKTDWEAA